MRLKPGDFMQLGDMIYLSPKEFCHVVKSDLIGETVDDRIVYRSDPPSNYKEQVKILRQALQNTRQTLSNITLGCLTGEMQTIGMNELINIDKALEATK